MHDCLTDSELSELVANELTSSQLKRASAHLDVCAGCARRAAGFASDEDRLIGCLRDAGPPPATPDSGVELPANELPGYELHAILGRGGQGVVYRAKQLSTCRDVAIKVLHDGPFADERARRRFRREIGLVTRLRHPSVVTVFDSGKTLSGQEYYVMDLVDGMPFDAYVWSHGLSPPRIAELAAKVCDVVQVAHQRGILHRDLKPSNILIDREGSPRLLDFGLAQAVAGSDQTSLSVSGTPAYIAPEQITDGPGCLDVRSDVYSLGVILYESLSGRLPYPEARHAGDAVRHIVESAPAVLEVAGSAGRDFRIDARSIVAQALSKDMEGRYQSAADLARDLRRLVAGEPIEAKRDRSWYVIKKLAKRHRSAAFLATAMLIVVVGGLVGLSILYDQARDAESAAAREARIAGEVSGFLLDMLESANPYNLAENDVRVGDILDAASARIDDRFGNDGAIEASIRHTLGKTYLALANYEAAERHLSRALDLRRELPEAADAATVETTCLLAATLRHLSRYDEAGALLDGALDALDAGTTSEPQDAAVEVARGRAHVELGRLSLSVGNPGRAEAYFCEAVRILEGHEGFESERHRAEFFLSQVLTAQGRIEEGEARLRALLAREREEPGESRSILVAVLQELGKVLSRKEALSESDAMFNEALDILRPRLGGHPHVASIMNSLADNAIHRGDVSAARQWQGAALEILRGRFGERHVRIANFLHNRANLTANFDLDEAEGDLRAALDIYEESMGETSTHTAMCRFSLGKVVFLQGKTAEGLELLNQALAVQIKIFPEGNTDVANTHHAIGFFQMQSGDSVSAAPHLEKALQLFERDLPPEHSFVASGHSMYGRCLLGLKRYAEAEEHLSRGLELVGSQHGRWSGKAEFAMEGMIELYEATGRVEAAAKMRSSLEEMRADEAKADTES